MQPYFVLYCTGTNDRLAAAASLRTPAALARTARGGQLRAGGRPSSEKWSGHSSLCRCSMRLRSSFSRRLRRYIAVVPWGASGASSQSSFALRVKKKARLADMAARGVILGSGARRCKWRSARCLAIFASQSKRGNVTWHGEGKSWSI